LEDANKNMAELRDAIMAELNDTSSQTLRLTGTLFNSLNDMFDNLTISKTVHLEKTIFDRTLFFRNVTFEKPLYMNEARFTKGVEFDNVEFLDDFHLDHATANPGRVCIFTGAKFRKGASFHNAHFNSDVRIWSKMDPNGDAVLEETRFAECVNFKRTEFQSTVSFKGKGVVFEMGADFEECHINAGFSFHRVEFRAGRLSILPRNIPGGLNFTECQLGSAVFFSQSLSQSKPLFRECDLQGVRLLGLLDFIETVRLKDCAWPRKPNRRFFEDRYCVADETDDPKSQRLLELYGILHQRFYEKKQFDLSGGFYESFMITKRKVSKGKWAAKIIDWVYCVLSRYGESIKRPACALVVMWLVAPILLLWLGIPLVESGEPVAFDVTHLTPFSHYLKAIQVNFSLSTFLRSNSMRPPLASIQNTVLIGETLLNGFFLGFLALGIRRHFAPKKPV
jgi:uncharacterized protein YjbI with pentapeptide repeats